MRKNNKSQQAIKKRNFSAVSGIDWMLVLIVVVLIIFGLIMLYSASSYNSQIQFGTSAWYVRKQMFSSILGLVGMFVIAFIPLGFWRKIAIPLYIVGVISVLLILTPLGGEEINGAKRWLDLKIISVQPAEILKVALVVGMAFFIAKFIKYLDDWRIYIIGFSICLLACALTLFVTDDLGTAIIIFAMGFVMMLVAAPRVLYLVITIAAAVAAVVGVILIKPNKMVRVKAWMNLDQYSDDIGYQITQALYAIGSGGIFGKGLGKSTQKMGFVPESENDMIFSIICEELGIIGGIILILLIVLLIWRMKKIYDKTNDTFGKVLVAGVATHIAMQTFVNIGVVSNLLPNTGVPLPFMSYGGTAILFLLAEIGIVLAVGRIKQKAPVNKRDEYYRRDKERGVIYFQ